MSGTVTTPAGKVYPVKNLGWLVRHRAEVRLIVVQEHSSRKAAVLNHDATLTATLHDGTVYSTPFADLGICKAFVSGGRGVRGARRFPRAVIQVNECRAVERAERAAGLYTGKVRLTEGEHCPVPVTDKARS